MYSHMAECIVVFVGFTSVPDKGFVLEKETKNVKGRTKALSTSKHCRTKEPVQSFVEQRQHGHSGVMKELVQHQGRTIRAAMGVERLPVDGGSSDAVSSFARQKRKGDVRACRRYDMQRR